MPSPQPCPNCQREGAWLEHASVPAFVNYYRCQSGHVWNVPKNDPAGPIWFVTEVATDHAYPHFGQRSYQAQAPQLVTLA